MAKTGRKPKPPEKRLKARGFGLALDDGLYERVVAAAEASGRTIVSEVRYRLRVSLDEEISITDRLAKVKRQ